MAKNTEKGGDEPADEPVPAPAPVEAPAPAALQSVAIPVALPGQGIYAAMVGVLRGFDAVKKTRETTGYASYKFRGIDDVYNALHPLLGANAVFPVATVLKHDQIERETKEGKLQLYTLIHMRYRFLALDGSFVETEAIGEAQDMGDKSTNKAMSIAYKYACFQTFCIPTEDLIDPDAESPEPPVHPRNETNTSRARGKPQPERGRDGRGKVVDRPPTNEVPPYDAQAVRGAIAVADTKEVIAEIEKDINKAGMAGRIDQAVWSQLVFGLLSKAISLGVKPEAIESRIKNYGGRGMLSADQLAVLARGMEDLKADQPEPEPTTEAGDADTQASA